MGKRVIKRRIREIILVALSILFIITAVILSVGIFKSLSPILKANTSTNQEILRPLGSVTSVEKLRESLVRKNINFDEIKESSSSGDLIIGKIKDGPYVYFSATKDIDWQVRSLELILSKLTIDNRKPIYIDLRSARPIVKF